MYTRTTLALAFALVLQASTIDGAVAASLRGTHTAPGVRLSHAIVSVSGGSVPDRHALWEAVERFEAAGLDLPELDVVLSSDQDDCDGHLGLFDSRPRPRRATICSDYRFVFSHELAHAWVSVGANEARREAMMEVLELDVWSDPGTPWNQRGSELAAVVIQQAVAGPPLPRRLSRSRITRLLAYEALTGMVAPVLADWVAGREVGCDDRPTSQSRLIPDATGRRCSSTDQRQPATAPPVSRKAGLAHAQALFLRGQIQPGNGQDRRTYRRGPRSRRARSRSLATNATCLPRVGLRPAHARPAGVTPTRRSARRCPASPSTH